MAPSEPDEIWLPVPGFEGRYDVSDYGRVRSWLGWNGKPVPCILSLRLNPGGYRQVALYSAGAGRQSTPRVHKLVMLAFVGPCPDGLEVRHLDGDESNNALTNLVYGTKSENELDNVRLGTHANARKTHCPANHPYGAANTRIDREGRRHCRTCARDRDHARRACCPA